MMDDILEIIEKQTGKRFPRIATREELEKLGVGYLSKIGTSIIREYMGIDLRVSEKNICLVWKKEGSPNYELHRVADDLMDLLDILAPNSLRFS
jgi:hypothetical protein